MILTQATFRATGFASSLADALSSLSATLPKDGNPTASARFRFDRLLRVRFAECSPGNARWLRREFADADLRSELLDDVPDQLSVTVSS